MTIPFKIKERDGEPFKIVLNGVEELSPLVSSAQAAAADASASALSAYFANRRANLWPDSEFKLSAGDFDHEVGGYRLYSRSLTGKNATWDANYEHPYGRGAWLYNSASTNLMGFETHFPGPGTEEFEIEAGDVISIGFEVVATGGTVDIAARFVSAFTATSYTYSSVQLNGDAVAMDGTPKILKLENLTVPAGSVGIFEYLFDSAASNFAVLRHWVVKGAVAGDAPPIHTTEFEQRQLTTDRLGTELAEQTNFADLGRLRKFRAKASRRMMPTPEAVRIIWAAGGDSWSTNSDYMIGPLLAKLKERLGDGGVGWFGMGFTGGGSTAGDAGEVYYATRTGTWTSNYHNGSTSPNISDARSSTAGSIYQIRNLSGVSRPELTDVVLHFTGTADGVIRWRWGGGAWSANTNVQGTVGAQQALSLTGFPTGALSGASANVDNLEIEVVSGSVILGGVDFQSGDAMGIVCHKLGSSGSKASDWVTSMASGAWANGYGLLGEIDLHTHLLGVNDDYASVSTATFASEMGDIADAVLGAIDGVGLLLMTPPKMPTAPGPGAGYAAALRPIAASKRAAFLDLQPAFGDEPSEYADGTAVPMVKSDNAHPTAEYGAPAVAAEVERSLLWR